MKKSKKIIISIIGLLFIISIIYFINITKFNTNKILNGHSENWDIEYQIIDIKEESSDVLIKLNYKKFNSKKDIIHYKLTIFEDDRQSYNRKEDLTSKNNPITFRRINRNNIKNINNYKILIEWENNSETINLK